MVRGYKLTRHWLGHRRAHDKLVPPNFSRCPRCELPKLPHRICGNCGYYQQKKKDESGKRRNVPWMVVDIKKL